METSVDLMETSVDQYNLFAQLPNECIELIANGCDPATQRMLSWTNSALHDHILPMITPGGREILCYAALEGFTSVYELLMVGSAVSLSRDRTHLNNNVIMIDDVNTANCVAIKSPTATVVDWYIRGWVDHNVLMVAAMYDRVDIFEVIPFEPEKHEWIESLCRTAVQSYSVGVLRYVAQVLDAHVSREQADFLLSVESALFVSIWRNNLELLKWTYSRGVHIDVNNRGITYDSSLEILQFIHDQYNQLLRSGAFVAHMCNNRPELIPWIHNNVLEGVNAMKFAIHHNIRGLAEWLITNGWVITQSEYDKAREASRWDIIQMWREHDRIGDLQRS